MKALDVSMLIAIELDNRGPTIKEPWSSFPPPFAYRALLKAGRSNMPTHLGLEIWINIIK